MKGLLLFSLLITSMANAYENQYLRLKSLVTTSHHIISNNEIEIGVYKTNHFLGYLATTKVFTRRFKKIGQGQIQNYFVTPLALFDAANDNAWVIGRLYDERDNQHIHFYNNNPNKDFALTFKKDEYRSLFVQKGLQKAFLFPWPFFYQGHKYLLSELTIENDKLVEKKSTLDFGEGRDNPGEFVTDIKESNEMLYVLTISRVFVFHKKSKVLLAQYKIKDIVPDFISETLTPGKENLRGEHLHVDDEGFWLSIESHLKEEYLKKMFRPRKMKTPAVIIRSGDKVIKEIPEGYKDGHDPRKVSIKFDLNGKLLKYYYNLSWNTSMTPTLGGLLTFNSLSDGLQNMTFFYSDNERPYGEQQIISNFKSKENLNLLGLPYAPHDNSMHYRVIEATLFHQFY